MTLFKTEKPSRDKEKAIIAVQSTGMGMTKIGFNIPIELKTRLKMYAASNNVSYTDIIISLIEKHLKITEQ